MLTGRRLGVVFAGLGLLATMAAGAGAQMPGPAADAYLRGMQMAVDRTRMKRVLTVADTELAEFVTGRDRLLAGMAIAESERRGHPALADALLRRVADSTDAGLSALAAAAVGRVGNPDSVARLRAALADRRTAVRLAVALVLGKRGERAAIPALREGLRKGLGSGAGRADADRALSAADTLSRLGDTPSAPAVRALADRLNSGERRRICDAIARFPDAASRRKLQTMLAREPYGGTRAHAAEALGSTGSRKAVPPLVRALTDRSPDVRRASAVALARLGDRSAVPALRKAAGSPAPDAANAPTMDRKARLAASEAARALESGRSARL